MSKASFSVVLGRRTDRVHVVSFRPRTSVSTLAYLAEKPDLETHMGEEAACTPNSILKDQMECLKQALVL